MSTENTAMEAAYEYSKLVIKNAEFRGKIKGILGTLGGLYLLGRYQTWKENRKKEKEFTED